MDKKYNPLPPFLERAKPISALVDDDDGDEQQSSYSKAIYEGGDDKKKEESSDDDEGEDDEDEAAAQAAAQLYQQAVEDPVEDKKDKGKLFHPDLLYILLWHSLKTWFHVTWSWHLLFWLSWSLYIPVNQIYSVLWWQQFIMRLPFILGLIFLGISIICVTCCKKRAQSNQHLLSWLFGLYYVFNMGLSTWIFMRMYNDEYGCAEGLGGLETCTESDDVNKYIETTFKGFMFGFYFLLYKDIMDT